MAEPHLARSRERLNRLALILPGQWLGLMAVFWMRFVPALRPFDFSTPPPPLATVVVCGVLCAVPLVLPLAYFRPLPFERGPLYPTLGLHLFRKVAPDGDWINARLRRIDPTYRRIATRDALVEHLAGTYTNERGHLVLLLAGTCTQGFALVTGQYLWAAVLTVSNVAFNLYPVMHQRYKRARAARALALYEARLRRMP